MTMFQVFIIMACFIAGTTSLFLLLASMASNNNIKTPANTMPIIIKDNKMYDTQNDYDNNDPISPEEILDSLEPHVWVVDATAIAWFPTGVEAIEKYNKIEKFVVIKHGDKTLEVNKEDIAVFPEYAFNNL